MSDTVEVIAGGVVRSEEVPDGGYWYQEDDRSISGRDPQEYLNASAESKASGRWFYNPSFCSYSDYGGSTAEVANLKSVKARFEESERVQFFHGWYGTQCALFKLPLTEEEFGQLVEWGNELAKYPVLSDDRLAETEDELFERYVTDEASAIEEEIGRHSDVLVPLFIRFVQNRGLVCYDNACSAFFDIEDAVRDFKGYLQGVVEELLKGVVV